MYDFHWLSETLETLINPPSFLKGSWGSENSQLEVQERGAEMSAQWENIGLAWVRPGIKFSPWRGWAGETRKEIEEKLCSDVNFFLSIDIIPNRKSSIRK